MSCVLLPGRGKGNYKYESLVCFAWFLEWHEPPRLSSNVSGCLLPPTLPPFEHLDLMQRFFVCKNDRVHASGLRLATK